MTPKVCTVVADCYGNSKVLKSLKSRDYVNFTDPHNYIPQGEHTLIYGYSLAKAMFEHISIGNYEINSTTRWTFNEFESESDVYIEEWLDETLKLFFRYDAIPGEYGDAMFEQFKGVDLVFIYNGNHEVYLFDPSVAKCYSWTHEEVGYRLDIPVDQFIADMMEWFFDNEQAVYAWNGRNVEMSKHRFKVMPLFVQDIVYSVLGEWVTKDSVKRMMHPYPLKTPEWMKYLSHLPGVYTEMEPDDYSRRFVANAVEDYFSKAKIHFDRAKLMSFIRERNKAGADAKSLEKIHSALDSSHNVCIPYLSRNKVTGRMFSQRGVFNPINESDPAVLSSITSRFENGIIASLDYSTFEPSIISGLVGVDIKDDIHDKAAGLLRVSRVDAKRVNNMLLYGAGAASIAKEFKSLGVVSDHVSDYLTMMLPITQAVAAYKLELESEFEANGYITNAFGRRIWVKSRSGVFNNAIQSVAVDIFNAAALRSFEYLDTKLSELFMHRFDSLFVDVHPSETEVLDQIVSFMVEGPKGTFDVSVSVGPNLHELRALS